MDADTLAALLDKLLELKDDPETANALLDLIVEQPEPDAEKTDAE